MNKFIKIISLTIILFSVVFLGLYLVGKYVLPDIFGTTNIVTEAPLAVSGESILNKRAPSFSLPDTSGSYKTLTQYFGVPTVIIFWATWDKKSADELNIIDKYYINESNQAKLIKVLSINSQEDVSIASSFVRRGGYKTETVFDTFGDVSTSYNVKSLPTIYFISDKGVVEDVYVGVLSERMFGEKVDRLLSKKGVQ